MGTPTSWLFGGAPDGRLLGTLTFSQLSGVRFNFFSFSFSALNALLPALKIVNDEIIFVRGQATKPQHSKPM